MSYVLVKRNALGLHSKTVPAHMGYTSEQFEYRDLLRTIAGKWVEVYHRFDSKNCLVISDEGIRIQVNKNMIEKEQDYKGYSHCVCRDCDMVFLYSDATKLFDHKEECGGEVELLDVIASWGISNTASYNVFKMDNDRMLIGCNDNKPEWLAIDYFYVNGDNDLLDTTLGEEYNENNEHKAGVKIGDSVWFLSECMKV